MEDLLVAGALLQAVLIGNDVAVLGLIQQPQHAGEECRVPAEGRHQLEYVHA